jgi:hypothetical protein
MESELDILDIARKLVQYVIHLSKINNLKIKYKILLNGCLNRKWPIFGLKEL